MIVDDEQEVLELIGSMVEPLGWEVLKLSDSQEAARRLENEKFDGILLDVLMPELDGFELARRIRGSPLNRQIPIIMLTGLDDVDTMRKGFNAGATCFLGKPISQERLYGLFKAMRGPLLREKRRYARLPFRATVKCRPGPDFDRQFTSLSVTISEGGMLLATSGGSEEGQELRLEFEMPGPKKSLKLRGRVVRKQKPDTIGIEFIDIDPAQRAAIQDYISGGIKD